MTSPFGDRHGQHESELAQRRQPSHQTSGGLTHSVDTPQRLRNDESWVEISSRPSSSSLSSAGEAPEIVTTGLRTTPGQNSRRVRRPDISGVIRIIEGHQRPTSTSSQDEYEESESGEEPSLSGSNENIEQLPLSRARRQRQADLRSASDDEENRTALGRRPTEETSFTPQPNAFSHPPSASTSQRPVPGSYFPRHPVPPQQERRSYTSRSGSRQHASFDVPAPVPSRQVDHDEALRASLTTLLSVASAARGLPKRSVSESHTQGRTAVSRSEPMGLRIVPESELIGNSAPAPTATSPSTGTRPRSSPSISSHDAAEEKAKRKAAAPTKSAASPRATKKQKKSASVVEEALISPTLLTWVVSAGVVVLVSVVGFGAGYALGREVGRQEALELGLPMGMGVGENASCGREALRGVGGIRRFRWGGNGSRLVA